MKPAPPVTRRRIGAKASRPSRRGTREARRASAGARGAPARSLRSTEYAGLGAGRSSSAVVIRRTRQLEPRLLEDRLGEVGPRAVTVSRDVPEPLRQVRVDEPPNGRGQVADERRAAALVVDDRDLVALCAEAEHRPEEVVAGRAEEPRRPDRPTRSARRRPRRGASSGRRRRPGSGRPTRRTASACARRRRSRWRRSRAAP